MPGTSLQPVLDGLDSILERSGPAADETPRENVFERIGVSTPEFLRGPEPIVPEAVEAGLRGMNEEFIRMTLGEEPPTVEGQREAAREQLGPMGLGDVLGQMADVPRRGIAGGLSAGVRSIALADKLAGAAKTAGWAIVGTTAIQKGVPAPEVARFMEAVDALGESDDKDLDEYLSWKLADEIDRWAEEKFPTDPRLKGTFTEDLLVGAGTMAPFLGVGGAGGLIAGKAGQTIGVALAGMGLEGGMGVKEAKEAGKKAGLSDDEVATAGILHATIGLTEIAGAPLSALRLFSKMDKATGGMMEGALKRIAKRGAIEAIKGAAREGTQEAVQQLLGNWIAAGASGLVRAYQGNRKLFDGVLRAGLVGGTLGGLLTGFAGVTKAAYDGGMDNLIADMEAREAAGQKDPAPSQEKFKEEGFEADAEKPRPERRKVVENEKERRVADVKAKAETEAAPEAGVLTDVPAATDIPVGAVQLGVVSGFPDSSSVTRAVKGFFKRFWTVAGNLPSDAHQAKLLRDGDMRATIRESELLDRDLRRAIKIQFPGEAPETVLRDVNSVLHGEKQADVLPESIREPVRKIRDHVDLLSQRLIDSGAVEGELAATISANKGVYLNRSYRAFDDPKWAEKVPAEIRNRAKSLFRREYEPLGYSDAEIDGLMDAILYEAAESGSPIGLLGSRKLGSKDLSIFKQRKGVPPEIRSFLGEYTHPRVNYLKSVAKMAQVVANHQFLKTVRDTGLGVWLHERPNGPFIARIAAENSSAMHPLDGLYTTPEIKQAFERETAMAAETMVWWLRPILSAVYASKVSKTLFSYMTQVRNVTANPAIVAAAGDWNIFKSADAFKAMAADIASDNEVWRQKLLKYIRLRIVGESVRSEELRAAMKDVAGAKDPAKVIGASWPAKGGRLIFDIAQKSYQWGDEFFRIIRFENQRVKYKAADPSLTDAQLDQIAAEITHATTPTYSMVPEAIRLTRRVPLLGTFQSFWYEIMRMGVAIPRLAAKELANPNPKIKAIGAQRLASFLAVAGAFTATAAAMFRYLFGVDKEKDEAMRRFLPPWQENSEILHLGEMARGEYRIIDASYTDPWNYLKKPIIAFMRGEDYVQATVDAVAQSMEPLATEGIVAEALIDVRRNQTQNGRRIYNPEDSPDQIAKDILAHVGKSMEPGTMVSLRRIYKGMTNFVEPSGRTYDPAVEAVAMLTGQRIQEVDIRQGLRYRASDYAGRTNDATAIYRDVAGRRGTVAVEEIGAARSRSENARRKVFDDFQKDLKAARILGLSEQDIYQSLLAGGVGKESARKIIGGIYEPYRATKAILKRGDPDRSAIIRTIELQTADTQP